ncbi:MAG: protein kinase domain-containing protein [Gemmataceae bacterium]
MTGAYDPDDARDLVPNLSWETPPEGSAEEGVPSLAEYVTLPRPGRKFLQELIQLQLLGRSSAGHFLRQALDHLEEFTDTETLGAALVEAGLLTSYQLNCVLSGSTHGLILGNYRVLERLGAGSMGVVFLGEHALLKRRVAIKVLPVDEDLPSAILERFYAEMRVLADLHHPNIVMALDAGKIPGPAPGMPVLHYLVMELITGGDLEQYIVDHGPATIPQACEWIRQAACGLQEAHDHHLIHRDIKPSNLLLTSHNQVKLVDFGLVRQFTRLMTDPRALLGSIEFMSPEQSMDPTAVGVQTDIYSLGATLFWLLTGQTPFPPERSVARALRALQQGTPRRLRSMLPNAPIDLDLLVARMLDRDPMRRPQLPVTIMNALARFAAPAAIPWELYDLESLQQAEPAPPPAASNPSGSQEKGWRVLLVDSRPDFRRRLRSSLKELGCLCDEAIDGQMALAAAREQPFDLLIVDRDLPDLDGYELCRLIRERPPRPHLKILILSAQRDKNELAEALTHGADDFVDKNLDMRHLTAKVQHILRLKEAQDRADRLARHLLSTNRQLEHSLQARATDVRQAQDALLFAMAKMAESREGETPGHMRRLQLYCRHLGKQLAHASGWSAIISNAFLDQMERCIPLHDIGMIGLPDTILNKAGPLDAQERRLMETHTRVGANILDAIAREYGESLGFLAVAMVIVRYHHERFDGSGYPDGLAGDAIPPAARIVAVADVYDALRRPRLHKPALSHQEAVHVLLEQSAGQFDPAVLQAFQACQEEFGRIYNQVRN